MGISQMVKYLFSTSKLETVPARRATATAAAGLYRKVPEPVKNRRSRKLMSEPLGEA